jgi:hypothetical protein
MSAMRDRYCGQIGYFVPPWCTTENSEPKDAVLWACDIAERVLPIFDRAIPSDYRPRLAIEAGRDWAHGKLKMTDARMAAFAAHAAARQAHKMDFTRAAAAARAAGHAAATAHVIGHAPHPATYAVTVVLDPIAKRLW